jgi:hypothetical protein
LFATEAIPRPGCVSIANVKVSLVSGSITVGVTGALVVSERVVRAALALTGA